MRKLFTIILLVLLCANAMAYDFSAVCSTGQTLYYNITSDVEPYTVEIVPENESSPYYNVNPSGGLEMPETVEYNSITYSVAGIGNYAFRGCSGLTSVAIPNSVTSIGDDAFYECSGLLAVYFTGDIEQWCGIVFEGYSSNPLMYAHNLYFNDELLTDLVIPNTVTQVKAFAFYYATCITSITIGSSVSIIGNSAFERCTELTGDLILPNSLISIGIAAFRDCSGLTGELNIPDLVTDIGKNAFNTCTGFTGALIIPNSVASIGEMAFRYCRFTSVVIGNSVTSIGRIAFDSCEELTSVTIGRSVDTISEYAFDVCENITDIYILANTPPIIDNSNAFTSTTYSTATLWTPCGLTDTYGAATNWSSFTNIQERFLYELNVSSSNEQYGTASIRQQPDCTDAIAVIEATPNQGYQFVSWNDGNAENPRIITVTSDSTFVATFRSYSEIVCDNPCPAVTDQSMSETAIPYYATVELVFNIGEYVDVCITIKCPETIPIEYAGQQGVTITDMSITEFLNLPDGLSYCVSLVDMDPTTNNYATLHITGIPTTAGDYPFKLSCNVSGTLVSSSYPISNQDITFETGIDFIILEQGIKLIRVLSNNDAYGSVSGGGTYDDGSTVIISATPNEGYRFVQWNDGNAENPRTITVTSDSTFVANFEANTYTITVLSNNDAYGFVSGGGTYDEGSTATISATPYQGYRFVSWNDGSTDNPRTIVVSSDSTFVANFEPAEVVISITAPVNGSTIYTSSVSATVEVFNFEVGIDGNISFAIDDEEAIIGTETSHTFNDLTNGQHTITASLVATDQSIVATTSTTFTVNLVEPAYTAISDIQYTADNSGDSPLSNQTVWVRGIVTALDSDNFYIQDAEAAWSGLYIYNTNSSQTPSINDSVVVTGTISENYGLTELISTEIINKGSSAPINGLTLASISEIGEAYESVLVTVTGTCTNIGGTKKWTISDGTSIVVFGLTYTPTVGTSYTVTGIVDWLGTDGFWELKPRYENDIVVLTESSYTITVLSNNDAYGMVSGGGTYEEGSSVVISAMPYEGYRFVQWNDGNTDDMRTITVTSDSTFVANFEAEQAQQYTITVLSNNEAYGSVSGGGTYYDGDTVAILAIPNSGYNFVSWNDGNESNPRTIVVTSDSTFIADFAKCEITYTIDTVVNNFVTVGDHTFYSTGNYTFAVSHETACDTIYDINLTVLAEPVYDIGPNPTKSLLNINSDGFISAVEFYSVTGQLVLRKEVNGYEAEFDVEGLVDGVYILRIYGEESSLPSVTKIIKE